jgi:hypothetical protein
MTTLLVIVFLMAGAYDGGASTTMQKIEFRSASQCEEARKAVEGSGEMWNNKLARGGVWKVQAVCVQVSKP